MKRRLHHFLSNLELSQFHIFEWSDVVIDIREQFPLLDRELAMGIAERIKVRYPLNIKSRTPMVLTTDFMITTIINGRKKYIARTVKPAILLKKLRTIEKFEIE